MLCVKKMHLVRSCFGACKFHTSVAVSKISPGLYNNQMKIKSRLNNDHPNKRNAINKRGLILTGSERDQKWAKIVMNRANKSKQKLELITDEGLIKCESVKECFKDLDLRKQGIVIIGESEHGMKLKVVEREVAMKAYSEHLAKSVTASLRASDNKVVKKQDKNSKKEDNSKLKVVQVGWGITLNDLESQKKFEIERHWRKGYDVDVVIDDRRILDRENVGGNVYRKSQDLDEIESLRRSKIIVYLESQLQELGAKFQLEGKINTRLVISVKGMEVAGLTKDQKKAQKALEKEKRRQKLAARTIRANIEETPLVNRS